MAMLCDEQLSIHFILACTQMEQSDYLTSSSTDKYRVISYQGCADYKTLEYIINDHHHSDEIRVLNN
jgi:hypothetical protein